MKQGSKADAATHQPSKAELEDDVSIDATPEALAWAVTRGGADRCHRDKPDQDSSFSIENGGVRWAIGTFSVCPNGKRDRTP